MSNQVTLAATPRPRPGKGSSGRLRREGRVPVILYGNGVAPVALSVDGRDLYRALHTPAGRNVVLRLEVDGASHLTVARDVQIDPARGDVLHVDLVAVDRDVRITADVPVHLVDHERMRRDGGVVNHVLHTVTILASPLSIPDVLEVSLEGRGAGDRIRVEDLAPLLPAGADLTGDVHDAVATIDAPVGGSVETEAAAAAAAAAASEGSGASEG